MGAHQAVGHLVVAHQVGLLRQAQVLRIVKQRGKERKDTGGKALSLLANLREAIDPVREIEKQEKVDQGPLIGVHAGD